MAYYRPEKQRREEPPASSSSTAICFIDTQNYNCRKEGAIYQALDDAQMQVKYMVGNSMDGFRAIVLVQIRMKIAAGVGAPAAI